MGGGTRSAELTLPGFIHDVCSAAHPLGVASPFFRSLDLARHGLEWAEPEVPVAHALTPSRSVLLERDLTDRGALLDAELGRDAAAWARLFGPLASEWERLLPELLRPVIRPPRHPILMARFGLPALMPATTLARLAFREPAGRALFAGLAAHSMLRLGQPLSASFGLVLGMLAHAVGWPMARGGSGRVAAALEAEARALGVEIEVGRRVETLAELPAARAVLLDLTPRQVVAIARRPPAGRVPAAARGLPLRPGGPQARLGARRPDPVARPADGTRRHGAPRRLHARGRGVRGCRPSRPRR